MKSAALQELVRDVFGNRDTLERFESNPESVLKKYKLTEQEKKAVLSTQLKSGLVTSGSPQLEAALKPTMDWSAPIQ